MFGDVASDESLGWGVESVNETVVERFNSMVYDASNFWQLDNIFNETDSLEALDNSADIHAFADALDWLRPDYYGYVETDWECSDAKWNAYYESWDESIYDSLHECDEFDEWQFNHDEERWWVLMDAVDHKVNETDYVYEPKFSGNHVTNWTIVEQFDHVLEQAVEWRSVYLLTAIFNGTQELAMVPEKHAAFEEAVMACEPAASDEDYHGDYDWDCDNRKYQEYVDSDYAVYPDYDECNVAYFNEDMFNETVAEWDHLVSAVMSA